MTDYPRLTTQLIFQFLKTRPEFLEYIKKAHETKPVTEGTFNPDARIVKVVRRDQRALPKPAYEDIYCIDEADLIPMDSCLTPKDLTDADIALVANQPPATDIIEVTYYERRYGRDTAYFASKQDMVLIDTDNSIDDFNVAAGEGNWRKAYYILHALENHDTTEAGPWGTSVIECTINEGGLELFKAILRGADTAAVLCEGTQGSNVLHTIAEKGYTDFLQSLISIKPDLVRTMANRIDDFHRLPLHVAIINGNNDLAETLTTYTDLGMFWQPENHGYTMLMDAVSKENTRLVELLLGKVQPDPDSVIENLLAIDEALRERLIKARDNRGNTVMDAAGGASDYRIIELVYEALVSMGLALEKSSSLGYTLFNLLIHNRNREAIHQLVKRPDFDPKLFTIPDTYGQSPLLWAANYGLHDVCELLYPTYADSGLLLARSKFGSTALAAAAKNNYSSIVELLIQDPVVCAELVGIADNNGNSPLHWAACHGCVESCRILYDRMSTEQICMRTREDGYTALHIAVRYCHPEMFCFLLSNKEKGQALIKATDTQGRTALQLANEHYAGMVEMLTNAIQALEQ